MMMMIRWIPSGEVSVCLKRIVGNCDDGHMMFGYFVLANDNFVSTSASRRRKLGTLFVCIGSLHFCFCSHSEKQRLGLDLIFAEVPSKVVPHYHQANDFWCLGLCGIQVLIDPEAHLQLRVVVSFIFCVSFLMSC